MLKKTYQKKVSNIIKKATMGKNHEKMERSAKKVAEKKMGKKC